jgi:hemerythrin-like domain-containing protein
MTKPIKRSEHILQLSRDHHLSLLFCWKVRQGIKKEIDPVRMLSYILYFWEEHLLPHFSEEDILFKHVDDKRVQRAYAEHHEINDLVKSLSSIESKDNKVLMVTKIADLVDSHVRFEERELFPHLEAAIDESELAKIGKKLLEAQPEPILDTYKDEFWKD